MPQLLTLLGEQRSAVFEVTRGRMDVEYGDTAAKVLRSEEV
jgi:hypothetical protein